MANWFSLAVMLTLTFQMMFYVGMNLGFGFIQSISLPLVSYGKVATVVQYGTYGVMLSVFSFWFARKRHKANWLALERYKAQS